MQSDRNHIAIKNPCGLAWDSLTGCGNTRFCQSCSTPVVDLTAKSSEEIVDFVMKSNGKVCGRIRKSQVDRVIQSNRTNKHLLKTFMFFLIGFATVTDSNANPISNTASTPYNIQEYTHKSARTFESTHELKNDSIISLTGIVTDDNNERLPGVSVVLKGTTLGTETDLDGQFVLEIDAKKITQNSTLVFRYVGFMTNEVELGEKFEGLKVILGPDVVWLGEIRIPWYKRLWWRVTSPFRKGY